jgi:hypothetical protein
MSMFRRHKLLLLGSAAGAVAFGAGGAVLATASSSADAAPKLTEVQITQEALNLAAGMGDASPTSIEHVEGTREQLVSALSGDEVRAASEDVYAIVIRGQFVDSNAPRPSDAAAPSGSVLTVFIDATTGALTDFGIQNQVPDLTSLGPVTIDQ